MSYARIQASDGTTTRHEGTPTLEVLQAAVGGDVEVTSLERDADDAAVLWLNETGKRDGLPVNPRATMLARLWGNVGDAVIVGNVVLTGHADRYGSITDLPDTWLSYLLDGAREPA